MTFPNFETSHCNPNFAMALLTADLEKRLCSSQIHENLLEDSVENVCTLSDFDTDVRNDGRTFVNARYKVDGSSIVGTILRRPFQGLCNFVFEHDDMYAAAMVWVDNDRRITLEKIQKTYGSISFESFRHRQIYLVDLNQLEIRVAFLVPQAIDKTNLKGQVPKHIGAAKGLRWHQDEQPDDHSAIFAHGSLPDDSKYIILMHTNDTVVSTQFVLQKSSNAVSIASDSASESSVDSNQPPSSFVETILYGEHDGISDVRQALVWPECIQKVCKS